MDKRSAARCWCLSPTAYRVGASTSMVVSTPSNRTCPAKHFRSMATVSKNHGGSCEARRRITELALDHGSIGPYRYAAHVRYALDRGALTAHMEVENRAAIRLPYGLGFHPWFPRHPGTTLHAKAARVWLEDERHLPTGVVPIASRPQWDFSRPSLLPAAWVNNCFDGWDRRAEIAQSVDGIVLSIEASPELGVYILYSPSPKAGFFCFEPVSHVVDAHHGRGLTVLEAGATMRAGMRISWRPLRLKTPSGRAARRN